MGKPEAIASAEVIPPGLLTNTSAAPIHVGMSSTYPNTRNSALPPFPWRNSASTRSLASGFFPQITATWARCVSCRNDRTTCSAGFTPSAPAETRITGRSDRSLSCLRKAGLSVFLPNAGSTGIPLTVILSAGRPRVLR